MSKYICGNCGNLTEINGIIGDIGSNIWVIIKTIVLVAVFIGLLFVPVVGWIIDIALLFVPLTNKKKNYCPKCKTENCLIPVDSPKGKDLFNKYYQS